MRAHKTQHVIMAAMAAAGSIVLSAAVEPIRLLGVSAQGNAVLIEATEPASYAVTRPDPLTLLIDLRNVSVANAANRVERRGAIAGVKLEQATAFDGKALARIRVSLVRPVDYKIRSARNTIRLELAQTLAASAAMALRPTDPDAVLTGRTDAPSAIALSGREVVAAPAAVPPDTSTPPAAVPAAPIQQALADPAARARAGTSIDPMSALNAGSRTPRRTFVSPPAVAAQPEQAAQPRPTSPQQSAPAPAAKQTPTPAPPPQQTSQISTNQEKKFTGHPISLDYQGADLRAVLRAFAEISGLNILIDTDVQGSVDIILNDVPWDQALDVILRTNGLDYTVDGTIVRIARIETLKKEQDQKQQFLKSTADAGTLAVRTYSLSYAKATGVAPLVKRSVLSTRGDVQTDERTNTLIITDLPQRLDTVGQLLSTLDRPEPQVEIEARIISTTREFARTIGIQWGFNGRVSPELGNTTNLAFPNQGSLTGAVGLPAGAANSTIGLALGSVNGAFNLDVALTALERSGKGRILSTPRVTTQNNVEAEVTQGVQIPVQTVANNTVTVTFKDAALTMKVTPQITAANTVIMQITVENATPGAPVQNIPSIDTQRAITRVQVGDGMTTVIGGIFISREQNTKDRTPALHRIPLLGWLFRRDADTDESRELLIFITPRILKG